VSGPVADIGALDHLLTAEGVMTRVLHTDHAFHSPMVAAISDRFAARVAEVERRTPLIRCASTVTGRWLTDADVADPAYWARQMRDTVEFSDGLETALAIPGAIVLEVGPGHGLTDAARRNPAFTGQHLAIASMRAGRPPDDGAEDVRAVLSAVARLWLTGARIDWPRLHEAHPRRRVPLPTYPFERQRYLVDPLPPARAAGAAAPGPETAMGPHAFLAPNRGLPITGTAVGGPAEHPAEPPADGIESGVAALYSEVLGIPGLAADDDFFDLGGDSLSAAQLIARVSESFGVTVPLETVFNTPTIRGLAATVTELTAEPDPSEGTARWA
jgi:phthiocerol/phenolphthiocerol synthesis type-I polyketide synthase E